MLRISEWIKENFSTEDYIILKLDVEGSEYEVIPDLLKTGAIEYINSYTLNGIHIGAIKNPLWENIMKKYSKNLA